jgi:hypothetical protein
MPEHVQFGHLCDAGEASPKDGRVSRLFRSSLMASLLRRSSLMVITGSLSYPCMDDGVTQPSLKPLPNTALNQGPAPFRYACNDGKVLSVANVSLKFMVVGCVNMR